MKKSVSFTRILEDGAAHDPGNEPLDGGRSSGYANRITTFILYAMFFMMLVCMIFIMAEALISWKSTNDFICFNGDRISASMQFIANDTTHHQSEFDKLSYYVNQMEIKNKGILDASAISFLFEVFAIALVTAGIYLLSGAHQDLIRVRRQARQTMEEARLLQRRTKGILQQVRHYNLFITSYELSLTLSDLFWQAFALSNLVTARKFKRDPLFFNLRETGRQISTKLIDAKSKNTGIGSGTHTSLLDRSTRIKELLRSISCPKDILELYLAIDVLLKDKQFVDDYDEHKKIQIH